MFSEHFFLRAPLGGCFCNIQECLEVFKDTAKSEITREIFRFDYSKGSQNSDIPSKRVKITLCFYYNLYYECKRSIGKFIDMALAKKSTWTDDQSACVYNPIAEYFGAVLSQYQCGFMRDHCSQHSLLSLLHLLWNGVVGLIKVWSWFYLLRTS